MRWRIHNLKLDLEADEPLALPKEAARRLGVSPKAIHAHWLVKRSLDARRRPTFVYVLDVEVDPRAKIRLRGGRAELAPGPLDLTWPKARHHETRVAVIGAGPAGLFAALGLAKAGLKPIIIDRGKPVETRGKDVGALMNRAVLDPESNLCYGEGGAGTWSDGKLTTRISAPQVRQVLETLHEMGAPERILTDGKPHLGTDKLVKILKKLRKTLIGIGAEFRYSTRVDELIIDGDRLIALKLDSGERLDVDRTILAVGHSVRDFYHHLLDVGVAFEAKPFAVGFRVEHPQALINKIQYGRYAEHPLVPTADYRLSAQAGDRGVYSFCMCPGGQIMPTTTRHDEVVVNGMSNASRSGRWANSALVVTVTPEDFARYGGGVLAGTELQKQAEVAAATLGGGAFKAPAQRITDFLAGRASTALRKTTYRPGVTPSALDSLFDPMIIDALREALQLFGRKMPGFVTDDAVLHGVETRTSAPIRMTRGADLQSTSIRGLYPAGEGAGYAGGIVSAAVDGLKIASRIADELS